MADRTEPATERRRREVRERGQVARSADLTSATVVLAAAAALKFAGEDLTIGLIGLLRTSLSAPVWNAVDIPGVMEHLGSLIRLCAGSTLQIAALVTLAAVAINVFQVGFWYATEPLTPDPARIDPLAGARRILSSQGIVRLTGILLQMAVVAAIVTGFALVQLPTLLGSGGLGAAGLCRQLGSWLVSLGFQISLGLIALATLDYGYRLWKFEREIRMTKEELREELRQTEAGPQARQRRREARRNLAAARPEHAVDDAIAAR